MHLTSSPPGWPRQLVVGAPQAQEVRLGLKERSLLPRGPPA